MYCPGTQIYESLNRRHRDVLISPVEVPIITHSFWFIENFPGKYAGMPFERINHRNETVLYVCAYECGIIEKLQIAIHDGRAVGGP